MPANFNLDDPNNPLNILLAGRNPYGSAGWMPFGARDTMNLTGSLHDPASYTDPRYWEQYTEWDGDNGQRTGWRPRADVQERLGGREQLANTNIGGPAEAIDPSLVSYDEEFGLLTNPDNIGDTIRSRQVLTAMMLMAAPAAVGAVGAMAGGAGGAGAGGGLGLEATGSAGIGMGAGAGGTGLAGTGAGAGWGLTAEGSAGVGQVPGAGTVGGTVGAPAGITGGTGAFDWTNATGGVGNGGAEGGAGTGTTGGLTGNSTIDGLLSSAMRNPLQTAGLLQAVYGLFGGGGSGGGGGGGGGGGEGSGAKGGTGTGVPVGQGTSMRGAYQPNQITAAQLQNMRYARPRGT